MRAIKEASQTAENTVPDDGRQCRTPDTICISSTVCTGVLFLANLALLLVSCLLYTSPRVPPDIMKF